MTTATETPLAIDRTAYARLVARHTELPDHDCNGYVIVDFGESSFGLSRSRLFHGTFNPDTGEVDDRVAMFEAEAASLRGIKCRVNGRPFNSEGSGELAALNADAIHVEFGERHGTDSTGADDGDASSTLRSAGFSVKVAS
jgi:hypothetical protein